MTQSDVFLLASLSLLTCKHSASIFKYTILKQYKKNLVLIILKYTLNTVPNNTKPLNSVCNLFDLFNVLCFPHCCLSFFARFLIWCVDQRMKESDFQRAKCVMGFVPLRFDQISELSDLETMFVMWRS